MPNLIIIGHDVFIYSEGLRPRWMHLSKEELDSALDAVDYYANESNQPMHNYDNYNLGLTTLEDRSFKAIAAHLEGRGP